MNIQRIAAFSLGGIGGNPAGIVLAPALPADGVMQGLAAEIGYSETAFAAPIDAGWRVRYFAPAVEVPFCGHATIALGAALARAHGNDVYRLHLNNRIITVEGRCHGAELSAALQSPPTSSADAPADLLAASLALFGWTEADLDPLLPPAIAEAGARHLVLALRSRARLASMRYDLAAGRDVMQRGGILTISLVHAETPTLFHARNPFAAGGVYEDPATGAAAAALAGYLRDCAWPHGGAIDIHQGDDMGIPCRLHARIGSTPGESIRVSGAARGM